MRIYDPIAIATSHFIIDYHLTCINYVYAYVYAYASIIFKVIEMVSCMDMKYVYGGVENERIDMCMYMEYAYANGIGTYIRVNNII